MDKNLPGDCEWLTAEDELELSGLFAAGAFTPLEKEVMRRGASAKREVATFEELARRYTAGGDIERAKVMEAQATLAKLKFNKIGDVLRTQKPEGGIAERAQVIAEPAQSGEIEIPGAEEIFARRRSVAKMILWDNDFVHWFRLAVSVPAAFLAVMIPFSLINAFARFSSLLGWFLVAFFWVAPVLIPWVVLRLSVWITPGSLKKWAVYYAAGLLFVFWGLSLVLMQGRVNALGFLMPIAVLWLARESVRRIEVEGC